MKSSHSQGAAEKDWPPIPPFIESADREICACVNHINNAPLLWGFSACLPSPFYCSIKVN